MGDIREGDTRQGDTRRRVKLYALNAERQWDDRGTGHVTSMYVEKLKGVSLLVHAESDGSVLLETKIQHDTAYQKQQETLIVWSEGDNHDLALSFQEKDGCDDIWQKICSVLGKDPSVDITQDALEDDDERFDDTEESIHLPPCEIDKLDAIGELISSCMPFPDKRARLTNELELENYIKKLLGLFRVCEEAQNIKALHKLHEIFKSVFALNKNPLFEVMLSEESLFDVIGIFEYDPAHPQPKRHREYLKSVSRFKEVLPFSNLDLINKIHQTYRVQYLQDVVLPTPSLFEENMVSTLSSFIFFNKVEIVSVIQDDEKFLRELFSQITDLSTPDERRRDLILFLKEFCTFSQTLQQRGRENFFKVLINLGIFQTLEFTLTIDDSVVRLASVDILTFVTEYNPSMVRKYAIDQVNQVAYEQHIIIIIIEQMINDSDPELGMAVQLSTILRILVDPENMFSIDPNERGLFLGFFYKYCIDALIEPILSNVETGKPAREDTQFAHLLSIILELLSFCIEHNVYYVRCHLLNRDFIGDILILMKSKHTFLALTALRFFRKTIGLKDSSYYQYVIQKDLFAPIIEAFKRNNGRYNLLDSAIIEVFEFIRSSGIVSLSSYIINTYGKFLDKIDYVDTFKCLRILARSSDKIKDSVERREPRQLDEDEELWFNNDNDVPGVNANLDNRLPLKLSADYDEYNEKITDKKNLNLSFEDLENSKKFHDLNSVNRGSSPRCNISLTGSPPQNPPHVEVQTTRKGGLVDYPEDEDLEEGENSEEGRSPKRPRLSS